MLRRHLWKLILSAGLVLWALVIGGLAVAGGWDGTLAQMGLFFSQAALLTFGGAYAVLPYVYQGAVNEYRWLTAPQMIDGLALGFVNGLKFLPYIRDEVLPRLERAGLRSAA